MGPNDVLTLSGHVFTLKLDFTPRDNRKVNRAAWAASKVQLSGEGRDLKPDMKGMDLGAFTEALEDEKFKAVILKVAPSGSNLVIEEPSAILDFALDKLTVEDFEKLKAAVEEIVSPKARQTT